MGIFAMRWATHRSDMLELFFLILRASRQDL